MQNIRTKDLPGGITQIDTEYHQPGIAASYLMQEHDSALFIETGTSLAVPILLKVLDEKGTPREKVTHIIVTHVHLDHAGGSGELLRHLPNARLVVHPKGARHLIDPTKLIASATSVYGEKVVKEVYGVIQPIPAERVIEAGDNYTIDFNGRTLRVVDTPGHARHHFCLWDERTRGFFTGDVFGISYRAFDSDEGVFIFPTTTPVQFEPEVLKSSITRLMEFKPDRMYLTHFGVVTDTTRLADSLLKQIDQYITIAEQSAKEENRMEFLIQALEELFVEALTRHQVKMSREQMIQLLEMDIQLNAQGIDIYLERKSTAGKS